MTGTAWSHDPVRWFDEHFHQAADQVLDFLGGDGIRLEDKQVADVGCGDGIIDLGLAMKGSPKELVGFDLMDVDEAALLRSARAAGVTERLPSCLRFERSEPIRLPAKTDQFDLVITWSAFEHVSDVPGLLAEIRRVIKPAGVLFLQLWPFFASEHGGHLWPHYEGPFPHLLHRDDEILAHLDGRAATDPRRSAQDEYLSLNRITLDGLQRALLSSGFVVAKLSLMTNAVHIPRQLSHLSLSALGVGGVLLSAVAV